MQQSQQGSNHLISRHKKEKGRGEFGCNPKSTANSDRLKLKKKRIKVN